MQKKLAILMLVLLVPAVGLACGNQKNHGSSATAAVTMTGQIVNAVMQTGSGQALDHKSCDVGQASHAKMAFKSDADHQIYEITPAKDSQSDLNLKNFVDKRVEITALVHNSDQSKRVEIQTIKHLKDSEKISQLR